MEYIIILPITFEVIIGVLMLLLGAGYTFVANITDMIRGISWVSFFYGLFFRQGEKSFMLLEKGGLYGFYMVLSICFSERFFHIFHMHYVLSFLTMQKK
ncbi:MAG: hypothetical protein ACLU6Y_17880 [Ruminococcus sp.]